MPVFTNPAQTSSGAIITRPIQERHQHIRYADQDGTLVCIACPINWDDLRNLTGRLLTIADATFTDPVQRKAHKDVVNDMLRQWMRSIEEQAGYDPHDPPQS